MGYVKLKQQLTIDLLEAQGGFYVSGGVVELDSDADSDTRPIFYLRHWRRIERYEGSVRTHVFRAKIPAHRWVDFVRSVGRDLFNAPLDTSGYDTLAASGDYTTEELALMREEWGIPS